MFRKSLLLIFTVVMAFCSTVSAQITVLGKNTNDLILPRFWLQQGNASNLVIGVSSNSSRVWPNFMLTNVLSGKSFYGTNYITNASDAFSLDWWDANAAAWVHYTFGTANNVLLDTTNNVSRVGAVENLLRKTIISPLIENGTVSNVTVMGIQPATNSPGFSWYDGVAYQLYSITNGGTNSIIRVQDLNTNQFNGAWPPSIKSSAIFTNPVLNGYVNMSGASNVNIPKLTNTVIVSPVMTNAVNYGNAISSVGSAQYAQQFGTSASAEGYASLAVGYGARATNQAGVAIGGAATSYGTNASSLGTGAMADGFNAIALGSYSHAGSNSIAIGANSTANNDSIAIGTGAASTTSNQIILGSAYHAVTIPGSITLKSQSHALVTGDNNDVVFTNSFIKITSGPSAAFTVNGIAGGWDGKMIILYNSTEHAMTLANDTGTTANRIYTLVGSNIVTTAATLIYDGTAQKWIAVSVR